MKLVVCDAGLGNLRSVARALVAAGATKVAVSRDPEVVRRADAVVVPGQGAFGAFSRELGASGLGEAVLEKIRRGAPYLGICLGLQVLFESSEEAPGVSGLGVMKGAVVRIAAGTDGEAGRALKIPHVGWNTVERGPAPSLLPETPTHFYFVHSYVAAPLDASVVAGTTEYGARFVSAVAKDNVFACQFHPEKSQRAGLALLSRFLEHRGS